MRVYNFVDIINGKVPFEKKMYSSRGFVVKSPLLFAELAYFPTYVKALYDPYPNAIAELPPEYKAIKLYYFKILEGPIQVGNYYRYRIRMYYDLF